MPRPKKADNVGSEELAVYVRQDVEGQPEEELEQARALLKEYSHNAPPAAHLRFGRACLATDRLEDARKAADQAVRLCKESGDSIRLVSAQTLLCDVHLQAKEPDDAVDVASEAVELCNQQRDTQGLATMLSRKAVALGCSGQTVDSLRTANQALHAWREVGDPSGEVEALIVEVEAQVAIAEERAGDKAANLTLSHWRSAELAVRAAETWRSRDHACLGAALHVQARVCQHLGKFVTAQLSAKAAAKAFRKARQIKKRAQALILCAEADMERGYLQDAKSSASRALDIFERLGDEAGLLRVSDLYDSVDRKLGIPTRAEIEAQQAQLELQQQMWQAQQQQGQLLQYQQQPVEVDAAPPPKPANVGGLSIVRDGVPLELLAMVQQEAVEAKIMELIKNIAVSSGILQEGAALQIELDMPLMEVGITSSTAVILRDMMSQDLPGVKLPSTIIFDYPSVSSIAEFVVEKSAVALNRAAG